MIIKDNHDITSVKKWHHNITFVYKGTRLVWQAIRNLSAWFRSEGWFRSDAW
ncbi:MAG: hypothetical protein II604_01445 [Bacteroidales bacterium]|nr:hypothetical protein [Bacteroidales bacterium]